MTYYRRRRVNLRNVFLILLIFAVGLGILLFVASKLLGGNNNSDVINHETPVQLTFGEPLNVVFPSELPQKYYYDSGIDIPYPADGVRGIYMSAYGFANEYLHDRNIDLIEKSNLNAIVLDVKDDWGTITMDFHSSNPYIIENTNGILEAQTTLQEFEDRQIYPIARIVTFKDSHFAVNHPEYAFRRADGTVWTNHGGEAFLNPFMQEVWDYTVDIAIEAAKAGFKEIQFDYIRFAENFGRFQPELSYSMGRYEGVDKPMEELRVQAINEFIDYAKEKLKPYRVHVGIDIFGYTATVPEDNEIGQNFGQMASRADVVSSMIYPSHWGPGYFGLQAPDTKPYEVVNEYIKQELALLNSLSHTPITRPWLQDFTASYLGAGWFIPYGPDQVKAQVQALYDNGVKEFLLWNASNQYSPLTDY